MIPGTAMMTSTSSNSSNGKPLLKTLMTVLLTGLLGSIAIYQVTLGGEVVSTEDGRRLAILRAPRALPFATVAPAPGRTLDGMLRGDGRVAIVSFMYIGCNTVCAALGTAFQQLQKTIHGRGLERQVRLVSISFDPRDDAQGLAAYARRQQADPSLWEIVGIPSGTERQAVLDAFGVVVLPAPLGQFEHNAALHLIDTRGRLARVDDDDKPAQALADAVAMFQAAHQ